MKKTKSLIATLIGTFAVNCHAANLVEVYQQAQMSDPIFQQAVAQRLATKEGVPISVATILPNINFNTDPNVARIGYSGTNFDPVTTNSGTYINPRNITERSYTFNLSATQTVFDMAKFSIVAQQVSLSKGADATLNAALQNLMTRVAAAYFAILQDEDNLSYSQASKLAYKEQMDQVKQQYEVGLKTITDVYTAQASYDSAVATVIAAETTLANDRENLRVITGVYYSHLSALSDDFPLITPRPANVETWVSIAARQNWTVKATQYSVQSAREFIRQQQAGHLPTLNVQTTFTRQYEENINNYTTFSERNGPGTTSDRMVALNVNVPIFAGGGVVASTNQATYQYQSSQQQLEQTLRNTVNATRQSYLNVVAGVSKIKADKEAIKSSISSLEGFEASYRVGTETLVDVLNQQQKVFEAQTQYATDRYAFVNNLFALKQAAGTLSFNDLCAVNKWLVERRYKAPKTSVSKSLSKRQHSEKEHSV